MVPRLLDLASQGQKELHGRFHATYERFLTLTLYRSLQAVRCAVPALGQARPLSVLLARLRHPREALHGRAAGADPQDHSSRLTGNYKNLIDHKCVNAVWFIRDSALSKL